MRVLMVGVGQRLGWLLLREGHRVAAVVSRADERTPSFERPDTVRDEWSAPSDDSLVVEWSSDASAEYVVEQALTFLGGCDVVVTGAVGRRSGSRPLPAAPAPWLGQMPDAALLSAFAALIGVPAPCPVVVLVMGDRTGRFDPPGAERVALDAAESIVSQTFGVSCHRVPLEADQVETVALLESLVGVRVRPMSARGVPEAVPSVPGRFETRDGSSIEVTGPHDNLAEGWLAAIDEAGYWPLALALEPDESWVRGLVGPLDQFSLPLARSLALADRREPPITRDTTPAITPQEARDLIGGLKWMCRVEVGDPSDSLAILGLTSPNANIHPHEHTATFRRWHRRYGAVPVYAGYYRIGVHVARPPESLPEALELAREHLVYCAEGSLKLNYEGSWDAITDLESAVAAYAPELIGLRRWRFWWD